MITESFFDPALVWLGRAALDREIARGADLTHTPRLARRARQLTSRRGRLGIARGLRNVVRAADHPDRALTSAVPVQRHEILREQGFILQIALDLESDDAVSARGVALLERMLTDGGSPFYAPSPKGTLRHALTHAHAALHLA
jgi:hypothetical protein